jgi:hypothetical protein
MVVSGGKTPMVNWQAAAQNYSKRTKFSITMNNSKTERQPSQHNNR